MQSRDNHSTECRGSATMQAHANPLPAAGAIASMRTIYPLSESKDTFLDRLGSPYGRKVARRRRLGYEPYTPSDPETLARTLRPGDVLLIEGNQKVSAAIKYLTQSTWSHAAFFAGDEMPLTLDQATLPVIERPQLIEVNIGEGCVAVPLEEILHRSTRASADRSALTPDDRDTVAGRLHDRPARHEIRPEEHSRHAALFHAGTAGARALASPPAGASVRAIRRGRSARR